MTPHVEELYKFRKTKDITTHVRAVTMGDTVYVEFRDWLETRQRWGRGYWIPADKTILLESASALMMVAEGLDDD